MKKKPKFVVVATKRINGAHLTYVCDDYVNYRDPKLRFLKYAYIDKSDFTADRLDQMSGEFREAVTYDVPVNLVIEIRMDKKTLRKREFLIKSDPIDPRQD